ncbi:HEAT repeat domain-containing protein [Vreelandella massiliensis]|uniref:HEAT repeat domain-containing protein n=1 Tax=Vreelandella massiliensis TaxID=1816686 RepID=UPI00096A5745|nr:HEAT repeat domain-containing protein [Halomonas massiliensis]MYL25103.1 HEAT repeat domain-containing protein [Halomonas alkaliantarctica]
MALKRPDTDHALPAQERRQQERDSATLLAELKIEQAPIRRWAARDLGRHPEAAEALLVALNDEPDASVREALFCSLEEIAHHDPSSEVSMMITRGLLTFLRSDSALLRNEAIDVLQTLPESVAPHLDALLNDEDADVRILALDILRALPHPNSPVWVTQVLARETHPNVLGAAVDRATELGTSDMLPALKVLQAQPDLPSYLRFAIKIALERIEDDEPQGSQAW